MKPTKTKYLAIQHYTLDPLNYRLKITFQEHPNKQPPPNDPTPQRIIAYWTTNNTTTTLPYLIIELPHDTATYQPEGHQQETQPQHTYTYTRFTPLTQTPQQILQQATQQLLQ